MSDINAPQRMGAALTYARRYAMFTLVGIAGEDDLDAPDLDVASSGPAPEAVVSQGVTTANKPYSGNGRARASQRAKTALIHQSTLPTEDSARLRAGMLAEIESIASSEAATSWANTMMRVKNTLTADDARSVESAFEIKCARLATDLGVSGRCALSSPTTVTLFQMLGERTLPKM
jgi:hypothetical protein